MVRKPSVESVEGAAGAASSLPGQLRLWAPPPLIDEDEPVGRPGDLSGELSPRMRLSEFLPFYTAARDRRRSRPLSGPTRDTFSRAIRRWIEATGDPPIEEIAAETCRRFVDWLLSRKEKSRGSIETVRKECRHVQAVMDLAGPAGPANRDGPSEWGLFGRLGAGWPRQPPSIPAPRAGERREGTAWTPADAEAFRAAAEAAARRPRIEECTAAHWWRAAVDVVMGTGLRRRTLLALQRSWLDEPGRVLVVPGEALKSGRRTVIYASRLVREAIARMPTGETVFPWPYRRKDGEPNTSTLHAEFRRILAASAVPASKRRRAGFHCFRRGLGDSLWPKDPDAAQATLGHAERSTTEGHYTRAQTRALAAGEHLERLAEEVLAGRERLLF